MTHRQSTRNRQHRIRQMVATLIAAGLVAAACGGDDDDTDAPSETQTPAATAASGEGTDTTAAGAEGSAPESTDVAASEPSGVALDESARLRFAYTLAAANGYDPIRSSGGFSGASLYPVYDRLVHLNPDATPKPGLATSWEFSDDGLAMDMQLREGVLFHDGEPFNAEAVKANIERSKTDERSIIQGELALVESVEVLGEYSVRFHLTEPMASLPILLTERPGMMVSPAAFDNEDLLTNPVGAGAYRVVAFDPDASITFEAFEDYWDPESVNLAGIDFTVQVDATTRLNALINGELDLTYINPQDVPIAEDAGLTVVHEPLLSFQEITLNRDRPPFDDVRVRRALNMAIDREAIVQAIYDGVGAASVQHFPEGYFAHNADYPADYFGNDPEGAKALLAEAGYPDGLDFEFTVMNVPYVVSYATAVQAQWEQAGIRGEMVLLDPAAGAEKCWTNKDCDAFTVRLMAPDPVQTFKRLFTPTGSYSLSTDSTPELDTKIAEIEAAGDPEVRAQLIREANAIVVENALSVVVYLDESPLAYRADRVANVEYYKTGWMEFPGIGIVAE